MILAATDIGTTSQIGVILMEDEFSLEQQQKIKLCRSFRLSKEDAEFVVWNFKHCTINSNQFRSKNSKKGSPMFCCECNKEKEGG